MNGLLLPDRQVFLVDTHVNYDPTAEQLAEITVMAAEEMLRFGIKPKAALLSHSNFGTSNQPSAVKMRRTLELLREQAPWLEVDGEMHGDVALDGARADADAAQHPARVTPTCWCCPTSTPPTSPTTCSRPRPAATSPSARCCWVRPSRCTSSRQRPPCAASST
jgi:hypothetical protein